MQSFIESSIVKELCNKGIVDIGKGYFHTVALTINGQIYCWGFNNSGQMGNGSKGYNFLEPEENKYLKDIKIINISTGSEHLMALTDSNDVYLWGDNEFGQIGNGNDKKCQLTPYKLEKIGNGKIKDISCGYQHSVLLNENGFVFSWGRNNYGQLGIGSNENSKIPKIIEMKDIFIEKISCGKFHTLFLSNSKNVYEVGGYPSEQKIQNGIYSPVKLEMQQKFIDIVAHPLHQISIAYSENKEFYIWGWFNDKIHQIPTGKKFNSSNDILSLFCQITYKRNDEKLFLDDDFVKNGLYNSNYIEIEEIGKGSFGTVFKSRNIFSDKCYAIKKIIFKSDNEREIYKEYNIFLTLRGFNYEYIVENFDAWIENNSKSDNGTIEYEKSLCLYIEMELCDETLQKVIDEMNEISILKREGILTPMTYFIESEIFIELLKGVGYLHSQDPPLIHRDLKPANILLKKGSSGSCVKIADFGLVVFHEFTGQSHTTDKGTIKYMAPEIIKDKKYDTKSDIYGLGIIMEELFDIDINRSYSDNQSSLLMSEYQNATKLLEKMISPRICDRPNCFEILDYKHVWAIDDKKYDIRKDFEIIDLNSQEFAKSYVLSLIEYKLKTHRKNSFTYGISVCLDY